MTKQSKERPKEISIFEMFEGFEKRTINFTATNI
jgi:hypothetical protein